MDLDEKTVKLLTLGRLSERQGQVEQAEGLFRKVIEIAPKHPVAYQRLAIIRAKAGNFAEAEQFFSTAYRLAPRDAKLVTDIGYFYYLSSKPGRAEQFLRYALELDRNNQAAYNNLALVLGEQGRDEEAKSLFQQAGTEAQATANMAFLYAQRGQLDMASHTYSRALTLDSTMRPAAEALLKIAGLQERQETSVTRSGSTTHHAPREVEIVDVPQPRTAHPAAQATVQPTASPRNPGPATANAASLSVGDLAPSEGQQLSTPEHVEPVGAKPDRPSSSKSGGLFSWLVGGNDRPAQSDNAAADTPEINRLQTAMQASKTGSGVKGNASEPEATATSTDTRPSVSMRISDDDDTANASENVSAKTRQPRNEAMLPPRRVDTTAAEVPQQADQRGAHKSQPSDVTELSAPAKRRPPTSAGVKTTQRPMPAVYTTAPDEAGTESWKPCNVTTPAKNTNPEVSQQKSSRRVHRQQQTEAPAADGETRAPSEAMQQLLDGGKRARKSSRRTTAYPEG
jgi:Flp pilus assembly protein TadD